MDTNKHEKPRKHSGVQKVSGTSCEWEEFKDYFPGTRNTTKKKKKFVNSVRGT